jgi:hypothetical protein
VQAAPVCDGKHCVGTDRPRHGVGWVCPTVDGHFVDCQDEMFERIACNPGGPVVVIGADRPGQCDLAAQIECGEGGGLTRCFPFSE